MHMHLPFVSDDVGNTTTDAHPLGVPGAFAGVIGFNGDVDVFSVQVPPGGGKRLNITLNLADAYIATTLSSIPVQIWMLKLFSATAVAL